MTAYIILLVLAIFFASRIRTTDTTNKQYYSWLLLIAVMALFQGLRDYTVGTDTAGYCRSFVDNTGWLAKSYNFRQLSSFLDEPLFTLVNLFGKLLSSNYVGLLLAAAIVNVTCAMMAIRQNSVNATASVFAFITLAFYLFGFAAIRQSIALCIFMLSLQYLYSKQFWKYCAVIFIAALCHKSIIVALPFYFIVKMKYSVRSILLIILIGFATANLMPLLLAFGASIEERYDYYLEVARGGEMLTLFAVCLAAFFVWVRSTISQNRQRIYDINLHLVIVSAMIYLTIFFSGSNTELNRFAIYFQMPAVFLYADYYRAVFKENRGSKLPFFLVSMVFIAYYLVYVSTIGGIKIYQFNQSIFSA